MQAQALSVHDRFAGVQRASCVGGAQLSIDLSKAFDLMPRRILQTLLAESSLSPDEQAVLMQWHQTGRYRIQGRGSTEVSYVNLHCGVRQGCVLSPALWSLFTNHSQRRLDALNGEGWTAKRGTMYADDLRFRWTVHAEEELTEMRKEVRNIFIALREMGMQANPDKSTFLISIRGHQAKEWTKRWIRKDSKGNRHFHFGSDKAERVPVAEQFLYLGAMLSYRGFEVATVRHRIGVAAGHRERLRKILHARRVLSVGHRLRLWKIMAQTSQLYAIEAVGLTAEASKLLHVQTMRHLRAIFGSARHVDGDSDQLFMIKHGIPDCVELVRHRCDTLCKRLRQDIDLPCFDAPSILQWATKVRDALPAPYIAKARTQTPVVTPEAAVTSASQPAIQQGAPSPPPQGTQDADVEATFRCAHCDQVFSNLHDLKTHEGKAHKKIREKVDVHQGDGLNGLPVCTHCGAKFVKWQGLQRHIARQGCPALERGDPEAYAKSLSQPAVLPDVQRPEVLSVLRERWLGSPA